MPAKSAAARRLHKPEPAFLADAMLGSVARKLRIFGFDTTYIAHTADDLVLKLGVEQGRIILTADKEFFKRIVSRGDAKGVLVQGSSDFDDLLHIFAKLGIKSVSVATGSRRCAACNGRLAGRKQAEVSGAVPEAVIQRHGSFYQCDSCGKVYWDGSHLGRLRALAERLERDLACNTATTKG